MVIFMHLTRTETLLPLLTLGTLPGNRHYFQWEYQVLYPDTGTTSYGNIQTLEQNTDTMSLVILDTFPGHKHCVPWQYYMLYYIQAPLEDKDNMSNSNIHAPYKGTDTTVCPMVTSRHFTRTNCFSNLHVNNLSCNALGIWTFLQDVIIIFYFFYEQKMTKLASGNTLKIHQMCRILHEWKL